MGRTVPASKCLVISSRSRRISHGAAVFVSAPMFVWLVLSSGIYWERERGEVGLSLNLSLLVMHRLRKGGRTLLLIPHGLQEHAEFALA